MIYEILQTGEANATPGRELCKMLHINARTLRAVVERERRNGKPICASTYGKTPGYYVAADKKEMERYCRSLFQRAGALHKTRRACLQTIGDLPE